MTSRPLTRIVVAVDFGEASAAAVALAGTLAERLGAALVAVHAETLDVPPYFTREQFVRLEGELRSARQVAEASLRQFVGAHTRTPAAVRVVDRPAVEAVLDAASGADLADLIVAGTHGRHGARRWWLGSVAERIVREATVPVLVVHAAAEAPAPGVRDVLVLAGTPGDDARHWADLMASALGATVRQGPPVEQWAPAGIEPGTIVTVGLPHSPSGRHVHASIAALARTCPVPVLFVPVAAAQVVV